MQVVDVWLRIRCGNREAGLRPARTLLAAVGEDSEGCRAARAPGGLPCGRRGQRGEGMLNLERLGNITAELSASLVRSIVLPEGLLGRLARKGERGPRPEGAAPVPRPEEAGRPYLAAGAVLLSGSLPLGEDAVVACIRQAGGRNIRVAVVLAGASDPAAAGQAAARAFLKYGIREVDLLELPTREEAESARVADGIEGAQVVVICGDDALRTRDVLLGTAAHGAIARVLARNLAVAGAGPAGAVLADRFIVPGIAPEPGGRAGQPAASPPAGEPGRCTGAMDGLGLLPRIVVAAGFAAAQGHSRLLHAVGCQLGAHYLGLSLDSQAALLIRASEARVLGEGSVTFMDGREASCVPADTFSGQATVPVASDQPAVCGLKVHVLVAGYGLNLKTRRPMGPPREQLQAAGG